MWLMVPVGLLQIWKVEMIASLFIFFILGKSFVIICYDVAERKTLTHFYFYIQQIFFSDGFRRFIHDYWLFLQNI